MVENGSLIQRIYFRIQPSEKLSTKVIAKCRPLTEAEIKSGAKRVAVISNKTVRLESDGKVRFLKFFCASTYLKFNSHVTEQEYICNMSSKLCAKIYAAADIRINLPILLTNSYVMRKVMISSQT